MPARLIHRFGNSDRTFRGFEAASLADVRAGHFVFFGLADHRSQSQAVRDASWFAPVPERSSAGWDLGDADADCGTVCAAVRARGGRPIVVGGAVTQAVEFAQATAAEAVILLSTRLDFPAQLFDRHELIAIGCHDLLPAGSVRRWREAGGTIVPATGHEPLSDRIASACKGGGDRDRGAIFIIDASVIDTGAAAGASTLNVGGLMPLEFLAAVRGMSAACEVAGMALVDLAPHRDSRGHSELLLAEAIDIAVACSTIGVPA